MFTAYIPSRRAFYAPLGLTKERRLAKAYARGDELVCLSDIMRHFNDGLEVVLIYQSDDEA